jgi:hypothetical protein
MLENLSKSGVIRIQFLCLEFFDHRYIVDSIMKFSKPAAKMQFPIMEEQVLSFWEKNQIFQKSIDEKPDSERWAFYDGLCRLC